MTGQKLRRNPLALQLFLETSKSQATYLWLLWDVLSVDTAFTVQTLRARELPPQQRCTYLGCSCSTPAEGGLLLVTSCSVITHSNQLFCCQCKTAKSLTSSHHKFSDEGLCEDSLSCKQKREEHLPKNTINIVSQVKSDISHHPKDAFNLNSDGILVYPFPPGYKEDSQQRKVPSRKDTLPPLSKVFERSPSKVREPRETLQPQTETAGGKSHPPWLQQAIWDRGKSRQQHLLTPSICPAQ